ncbi:MAG: lactate utilization protein [Anaerolineae bacterium]
MTPPARDEILEKLRRRLRPVAHPHAWQSPRRFDDLAVRFAETLRAAGGEVICVEGIEEAAAALGDVLTGCAINRVVVNTDLPAEIHRLRDHHPGCDWYVVGQGKGDLREVAAAADAGLSTAEAVLAETGTVVIRSGRGLSRLVPLLPPIHIVLAPFSALTEDIFTWIAARRGPMPANITLISGPSKTADIEQTLAIGVHGPGRLIVILYRE